jgi:putative ABC transport system permease protein
MGIFRRFRNALLPGRVDRDIDDELEFHRQMRLLKAREQGLSPEAADREVKLRVGNVSLAKDEMRDARVIGWLASSLQDFRHAVVWQRRDAGTSALIVLVLALGIGASTAMFSFAHPMLLHPLLYPRADRLVAIEARDPKGRRGVSWPEYRDYSKQASVFSDVGAFDIGFFFLTGVDEPEQIAGSLVTPNLFRTLGVAPAIGRGFRDGEDGVVILSDGCWKRHFGGDAGILGRSIALDFARTPEAERYTVIGVMPPDFRMYYSAFEVFVPLPRAAMGEDRNARGLAVIARLRDGATIEQARSALSAIPHEKDWTIAVSSWEKSQTQDIRPSFLVLAGGAILLLLIATANVAGLLLVRTQGRRREIAIRAALGAGPARITRMLIGESVKLGALGGGIGVILCWWGLRIMVASLPSGGLFNFLPSLHRVVIDTPALGFAVGAAMFACLMAGVFPALAARHADLIAGLKNMAAIDSPRARTILVTGEIAVSVMLLAGAGLLIKTMQRIRAIDPGFQPDHLLVLRVPVPRATDRGKAEAYYRELQTRLAALPGVQSIALTSSQPLIGLPGQEEQFEIPGRHDLAETQNNVVTPDYFATLGIPIRRGRAFDARDDHRAVISESLARKYWAGRDPIGKSIRVRGESIEIMGISGDTRDVLLRDPSPILYRPWRDEPDRAQLVDIRTWADPLALAQAVRRVVRDLGGVVADVHRGREFIEDVTWQQKQSARILSVFAGIALALAVVGLYGVISLAVGGRTREIGVRMAIGARRSDVAGLVLRQSLGPALAGLALGLAAALGMSRVVANMLYEVAPSDPMVLALVTGTVVVATMCACLLPLRRALRVDPLAALRCE